MGSPQDSVRSAQMPKHAGGARCLPQSRRRHSTSVSRARALAAPPIHAGPRPGSIGVPARRRSTYDRGTSPAPIRFPPDNFKHSLTLFSKFFSSFPCGSGHDGTLTLSGAPFQGTWARSPLRTLLQTTIRTTEPPDYKAGLFLIRSSLLRESLRALGLMASGATCIKDKMVLGILQFTPSIAFCNVLHRCESRDIRCRESFLFTEEAQVPPTHAADGARRAGYRFKYSLCHAPNPIKADWHPLPVRLGRTNL
ncbi:hypothetical protein CQW23_34973 [Capsicum baccatum]|uniref:Uncharacterized protein n=1 Tax=Capsicum baccatum TaxID=33114 RepID=A0A2G2UXC6_CAPBA|nr:hypothetical protein CQW23_34973 [Capsicum baccatum]